ncbi:MAG: C-terminal target protein [Chlorobi bacterium]|nr:C-terminal target protein [Chlorobiota bacterium]
MRFPHLLRSAIHSHARAFSLAVLGVLLSASASFAAGHPNILIRDCPADIGAEPNSTACGGSFWTSSAIWVRNVADGLLTHQSPLAGQTNYVYVNLENIGTGTLNNGTLHVYFAKASTGLTWPTSWVANYLPSCLGPGTTTYGDEIGTYAISGLGAGGTITAMIPWSTVPNPGDFCDPDARHFCLLARFESNEDPMTFTEGPLVLDNTRNNNNIAWKNCSITGGTGHKCPLQVRNPENQLMTMALHLDIDPAEINDPFTNHGTIQIDLGPDLFREWTDGGQQGTGVTPVNPNDADNTTVNVTALNAQIENITMNPGEEATIHVIFTINPDQNVGTFHWDITQYEAGSADPLGGEQYIIDLSNGGGEGGGKRAVTDGVLSSTFNLGVHPNPSAAMTTISYALPADSRVGITIFDASGRPVTELLPKTDMTAGSHQIVWNGQYANGKRVPSGTYLCRLSTETGSTEQQIKITR